jgi:hypothetical protein
MQHVSSSSRGFMRYIPTQVNSEHKEEFEPARTIRRVLVSVRMPQVEAVISPPVPTTV